MFWIIFLEPQIFKTQIFRSLLKENFAYEASQVLLSTN